MAKPPDRQARLSEALRENLKRRKAHARRAPEADPGPDEVASPSAEVEEAVAPRPNSADKKSQK